MRAEEGVPVPGGTLAAALDSADLSSLVMLRVLLARADENGWISRQELLAGVGAEYEELYSTPGAPVPFADEALGYLDEHVLPHLARAGFLEPRDTDDQIPAADSTPRSRAGIRLSPTVLESGRIDRARLAALVDEKIGGVVGVSPPPDQVDGGPDAVDAPLIAAPGASVQEAPASSNGRSTLSAKGLVKVYRKRQVVNEVDLHVAEGEIVGLLGPNGAGKTTTFYMMVGLIAPDRGSVHLGSDTLTSVPMYKRARRGIGYLAQEPSIFRKLTVEENVLAILEMRGDIPRRERRQRLEHLLDELGIKHLRSSKAYSLSGGERRRLEITRALVGAPRFMLLDEPFAGVDPIAVHDIQQIVADLRHRGIGVLISDHNVEQTLDIVDRAYIMYDGRVRVSGTVSELVWNDEVAEIYLGPTLTARMRQRYSRPV